MISLGLWSAPCSQESEEPSYGVVETSQFRLSLQDTDFSIARTRIYELTSDRLSITVGGLQRDQDRLVFNQEMLRRRRKSSVCWNRLISKD